MTIRSNPTFLAAFGIRVAQLRAERGLSLLDVARKSGLAPSTIGAIERGLSPTNLDTFYALARVLGVSSMDLINVAPEKDDRSYIVESVRTNPNAVLIIEHELGPRFKPRTAATHRRARTKSIQ